jgi:hypothetical protein
MFPKTDCAPHAKFTAVRKTQYRFQDVVLIYLSTVVFPKTDCAQRARQMYCRPQNPVPVSRRRVDFFISTVFTKTDSAPHAKYTAVRKTQYRYQDVVLISLKVLFRLSSPHYCLRQHIHTNYRYRLVDHACTNILSTVV